MPNNIASFFRNKFRIMPKEADIQLVQQIIGELKGIDIPAEGNFSFSPTQKKFVEALVGILIDVYTHYRFAECGGRLYRAFRESRADWKHGALENGPKLAEERISRQYWLVFGVVGRVDADVHDRVLKEFEVQLLIPLQKALREGIVQGSRLDHLISYLKNGIDQGRVYKTLQSADDVTKAEKAETDELWCKPVGYA
ncbi:MAG: hypothetical protein Q8L78_01680 [Coxiellaceae bacterium]|nr:hypothetical protein [Coxiellaceae bacterium]